MRARVGLAIAMLLLLTGAAKPEEFVLGSKLTESQIPFMCPSKDDVDNILEGIAAKFSGREALDLLKDPTGLEFSADEAKKEKIVGSGAKEAKARGFSVLDPRIEAKLPKVAKRIRENCYRLTVPPGGKPLETLVIVESGQLRTVDGLPVTVAGVLMRMEAEYTWLVDTTLVTPKPGSPEAEELNVVKSLMQEFKEFQ